MPIPLSPSAEPVQQLAECEQEVWALRLQWRPSHCCLGDGSVCQLEMQVSLKVVTLPVHTAKQQVFSRIGGGPAHAARPAHPRVYRIDRLPVMCA